MGAFDDLIPAGKAGAFDDLVPAKGAAPAERTTWEATKDLAASGLQGLVGVAKLPAMAIDKAVSGQWIGPGVEALSDFEQSVVDQKSPQLRAKEQAMQQRATDAGRAAQEAVGGGDGALPTAARFLGEFGVGAWESVKDPALLTSQLAQQVPMLAASRGAGLAANSAARGAAAVAPKLAGTAAGRAVVANAGTAGAVAGGAALQGADIGTDTYQRLMALPDSDWQKLPGYTELAASIGPEPAKSRLASDKAFVAALQAGAASVLSTALPGGTSVERALVGKGLSGASVPAAAGKAFVGEAVQEGVEEGYGALAGNYAVRDVNPTQDLAEGVGLASGQGAALGGIMGGGAAGVSAARDLIDQKRNPAVPPAGTGSLPAADVLGAAEPPSDAEKALTANPSELRPERITAVPGQATTFSTEAGAKLQGRYALVEAGEAQASHDVDLRPNPLYPADMQPRDRTRAASEAQIASIASKIDPARLGLSADAGTGAPIIGEDGFVESGNARTIALQRVYRQNGQKAEDYRGWLRDNAEAFGLTRDQVDGMRQPMLVRVRETPVDRAEFARQANASTVAAMSPLEQARADSARIDSMEDLRPDEQGEFATSREFIRRFVGRLPATEQAGMIDAGGQLSASGYARVRNAVLAKAYGDSPVLARMVESMDDNLRNVSRALMMAAPRVAQTRSMVEAGRLHPADLTPDLVAAVAELERIKSRGGSVADALAQRGLEGDRYTPEQRTLLEFLDENIRRPRKIAEFIGAYADALEAAGDPNQGSLLGESAAPTVKDLLAIAAKRTTAAGVDTTTDAQPVDPDAEKKALVRERMAAGKPLAVMTFGDGTVLVGASSDVSKAIPIEMTSAEYKAFTAAQAQDELADTADERTAARQAVQDAVRGPAARAAAAKRETASQPEAESAVPAADLLSQPEVEPAPAAAQTKAAPTAEAQAEQPAAAAETAAKPAAAAPDASAGTPDAAPTAKLAVAKPEGESPQRAGAAPDATASAKESEAPKPQNEIAKGKPAPLYASRPVLNAQAIIDWAASQGFKTTLPASDMHVTVAYSREPVDGTTVAAGEDAVSIPGGKRSVAPLGDNGAVVLKLSSAKMQERWQQYRDAGASWDYDGYQPHITITYDGKGVDLSNVEPYRGPIELGAETQAALDTDSVDSARSSEVPVPARSRVRPSSNMPDGVTIEDEKGQQYRVHYQRNALVLAHPIKDGKAVVSRDTTVRFWVDADRAPSGENDRTDAIYRVLRADESPAKTKLLKEEMEVKAEAPSPAAPPSKSAVSEAKAAPVLPVATRLRLEQIAERLGIKVNKTASGWHAGGGEVSIPSADMDAHGAVSPDHVFAHELGHAVMQRRQMSFKGFPLLEMRKWVDNWPQWVAASRAFRPGVHEHESQRFRDHAKRPDEIIADAIGSVLLGVSPPSLVVGHVAGLSERDLGLVGDEPASTGAAPRETDAAGAPKEQTSEGSKVPKRPREKQAASPDLPRSNAPIEDAGQKIGGARKDQWAERGLSAVDLDAMSESEGAQLATKANVWKPDYAAMAGAVGEPVTVAMIKVVYDSLAAKPKLNTPQGRRDYVTAMQAVRAVYGAVKTPEEAKIAYVKLREALGIDSASGMRAFDEDQKAKRRVLFSVYKGRSDPFVLGRDELLRAQKLVNSGFPGVVEPWTRRFVVRSVGGAGITEAGVKSYMRDAASLGTPMTEEQLRAGAWRVTDKAGKAMAYAATQEDAEAAAKQVYEGLKAGGEALQEPQRPHLDKLKREGLERAIDRDVTASDFIESFGFRGVEWGNWAAQDERQKIANLAFDALADLARVLNVPRRALSLNGTMGMAFGARGGGRFAAHYEPGKLVINMTKLRGAGSLAHEWAHAFDHYFGELGRPDAYQTLPRGASGWDAEGRYDGKPVKRMVKDADGKWTPETTRRLPNVRPELADKIDAVMRALFTGQQSKADMLKEMDAQIARAEQFAADAGQNVAVRDVATRQLENFRAARKEIESDPESATYPKGRSQFAAEAQKLSGKSSKGYWLRPTEMFARAFEAYVFDRLVAMGARSDYLVHGVEPERYAAGYRGNPYPTGAERAKINAAFDAMVAELKTREEEGGSVTLFSRRPGAGGSPDAVALQALAQNDDLYALPKSDKDTVQGIVADHDPLLQVREARITPVESMWTITFPDGSFGRITRRTQGVGPRIYGYEFNGGGYDPVLERPGENPEDVPETTADVWIDVSQLKPGGSGSLIYNVAATLAHNTGSIFIGDPSGVSTDAMRRRPQHMLSSALKFGTTKHLAPHPDQIKGSQKDGVPPLKWVYGDDAGNMERLIALNVEAVDNQLPAAKNLSFDVESGQFTNTATGVSGGAVSQELLSGLVDGAGEGGSGGLAAGGGRTLARTAVLRALLRQEGREGAAGGQRDGLLARLAGLADDHPASVAGTLYSRAAGTTGGMPIEALHAVAKRVQRSMANLPPVQVLQSPAEAPEALRQFIESRGAMGDVEAALHDGKIYLFADNLADEARAEHVLAEHEAAHAGLRGLLGGSLDNAMRTLYEANPRLRNQAEALIQQGASLAEAVEEVIVDIPSAELATLKGWRRFVQLVRDALRRVGFGRLALQVDGWLAGTLTQQQRADLMVADLVREARAYVAGRRRVRAFKSMEADNAAQAAWLTEQAKARGFKSVDDLIESDYGAFDGLAAMSRAQNPAAVLSRALNPDAPAFDASSGTVISDYRNDAPLKAHADYRAAKAGGAQAAANVVRDLVKPASVAAAREKFGADVVYVAPHAEEAAGRNKLPTMLAAFYATRAGGSVDSQIVQTNRAFHTGADAMGRLISRSEFAGDVVAGQRYVLVDDVTTMGGTLADLAAFIRARGGVVSGSVVLVNATRGGRMVADAKIVRTLEARHGDTIREQFGFGPASLTAEEAQYLVGFRTADELRNRVAAARQARFDRLGAKGVRQDTGQDGGLSRLSRATTAPGPTLRTAADRAEDILQTAAGTPKPLDAFARTLTRITGIERLTAATHGLGARLIDQMTPERVKAGVVSNYGVPEAVIDRRAAMQGTMRQQLQGAGRLIEKMATLTRAESRVAYEWMSGDDTRTADELMKDLPEESVEVLRQVRQMIDDLSKEAVRLGQLTPEAFERHRYAYLRRTYFKYAQELTGQEKAARQRAISILGDQYKGRGIDDAVPMAKIGNIAPDWWKRKLQAGKADASLKGEKFERLERRAHKGAGTPALDGMGENTRPPKLREVVYWPAGEPKPAKYADWDSAGTFEVRDVKGGNVIMWRDFTKAERVKMGEIDEARYAIGKTLHRMIHDIEVGRYLEWLSQNHAKLPGEPIAGTVVEASERYRDTFMPGEWVQVPDATIPGTSVKKYGKLAGQYLPGPIWNDLRQTVGRARFGPEWWRNILTMWKLSKTALSPVVHTNNVMSNFVMADWHDVTAGHVAKALRIILAAHPGDGRGVLGRAGNVAGQLGIADRDAARAIMDRYAASGGNIGSWVTSEIANEQLAPIVKQLQDELATVAGNAAPQEIGIYSALQHMLHARFPQAWQAFKASKPAGAVATDAKNMIDLYQAEDDVFRLAAWLKAKEDGQSDQAAGKAARQSFLDYDINAPWIAAARQSVLPFISYTYRAVPMLIRTAAAKPHKVIKLMAIAGALNMLGGMLAGGDDDDEARKMLPEEKAGGIWGMVPKLIRMPWNDVHGSPVFLDIRRWIPVGDVFDLGQTHSALPIPPWLMPGGPLMVLGEVLMNKSAFTGKPITLDTDTTIEKAAKITDHLWKAFAPNIALLPGTYAWQGISDATTGRTDAFGREQSVPQAVASSVGVKVGSYPPDVLRRNLEARAKAQIAEINMNIQQLKRQRMTNRIDQDEFQQQVAAQRAKQRRIMDELREKVD